MIDIEIKDEYENFCAFMLNKYRINIDENQDKLDYVQVSLYLVNALKIWSKNIENCSVIFKDSKCYFNEIISNIISSVTLSLLDLRIPALIMLRRSLENILTFIYYIEHPIEFYKKELDEASKNFNGFKALKDYIISYPFKCKNENIDNQQVRMLCKDILDRWTEQYKELSNYVHGSNSNYLDNKEYFDEMKDVDIKIILKNTEKLGSIINALLIVFFFNIYTNFKDEQEKSIIRNCIKNEFEFKEKLTIIFNEI